MEDLLQPSYIFLPKTNILFLAPNHPSPLWGPAQALHTIIASTKYLPLQRLEVVVGLATCPR